jgi:hypothetical protein
MAALGFWILIVTSAVALVLAVIAAPTDVYRQQSPGVSCWTLWGLKAQCTDNVYQCRLVDCGFCDELNSRLKAGEAFILIAIVTLAATLLLALMSVIMKMGKMRLVTAAVGFLATASLIIVFAVEANVYLNTYCGSRVKDSWNYGSSFGLTITAFGFILIGSAAQLVMKADFD